LGRIVTLEVHFFLMDSRQFLLGQNTPISKSGGQTQHYLLLGEFTGQRFILREKPGMVAGSLS
jgi:adenylate cyclase